MKFIALAISISMIIIFALSVIITIKLSSGRSDEELGTLFKV